MTFTAPVSDNCTVTVSTVHLTGSGSCTITAHQPGNANYLAAPDVPQTFTIAVSATLNVLWYTGGVGTNPGGVNEYFNKIGTLASGAPSWSPNRSWNVTFWESGPVPPSPVPYNVLVVASSVPEWYTRPNFSALNAAISSHAININPAENRVMLTGQDADWHYLTSPGPTNFNGPRGFLHNAINWAGSGAGMGLVLLGQDLDFASPAFGFTGFTPLDIADNDVVIPASESSIPLHNFLTGAGLSGWATSIHSQFQSSTLDTTQWHGITTATSSPTANYVTIVSTPFANGGLRP